MKTQLIRNFIVALFAAASVYAQGSPRLTVQVPFGFHVGASMLPAGKYTVDTDVAPSVVRLRSADSKSTVMILANSVQASTTTSQGKLIFNQYGDEYFLSQVWKAGTNAGSELRKTKREFEVASHARRGIQPVMASK
jgi:hypothetical protein